MKQLFSTVACVLLVAAAPLSADVIDDQESSSEAKSPHRELREAVAKIRSHYSPDYNAFVDYRLAGAGRHMRLGIILGPAAWKLAEQQEPGALIMAVTPGSPADAAGLLAGDVVKTFNGESLVEDTQDPSTASMRAARKLAELSRDLEEGDRVTLEYVRDGTRNRVDLVAREFEADAVIIGQLDNLKYPDGSRIGYAFPKIATRGWFFPHAWLDMELVALNPELGEYFGADGGVLVVKGPEDDDSLGLKSGDVILRIGDREVQSPEHAMRILRSYEPEEELILHIIRHKSSQTLTGTVPKSPVDFDYEWSFGDHWKPEER
jgi:S1-C subfamily serine protease